MRLVLMHRDVPVLEYEYIAEAGAITSVSFGSANYEQLPIGVWNERVARSRDVESSLIKAMNHWWKSRRVPDSRPASPYLRAIEAEKTNDDLLFGTLALSLSDQYWVQPTDMPFSWADVNYFDNDFSEEIGLALAGIKPVEADASPYDPSCSTNGQLPKMWTIDQAGTRQLLKGGSGLLRQEPVNELIATKLYERILEGAEFVPYELRARNGQRFSACPCMVTRDEDLITANDVFKSSLENSGSMDYGQLIKTAQDKFGVDWRPLIDRMLVCDFVLGNIDRHGGNFCLIRNARDCAQTRPAPIFDSGLSLLSYAPEQPQNVVEMMANPFSNRQANQLALVTDLTWLDVSKLEGFADEVAEILPMCHNRYMDEERVEYLRAFVESGIRTVERYAEALTHLRGASRFERADFVKDARRATLRDLSVPEIFSISDAPASIQHQSAAELPTKLARALDRNER